MKEDKDIVEFMTQLYIDSYLNAYKVIITGGCNFEDYDYMSEKLNELFWCSDIFEEHSIKIISGTEKGTEMLAMRYADEHEMTKVLFPVNRKEYSQMAVMLRNRDMLTIATHLVVFGDSESDETGLIIELAKEKGIPVWVF
ncbi:SLOG family protein [Bacteroides sp. GD17]|uniref:SLOG family protein n=1 Tax=uncultured Bacteroides sp. TaxID=162156 RepID=UPI0025DD2067|nr:SLOG family protein [uncultured Bacteroides sp.]